MKHPGRRKSKAQGYRLSLKERQHGLNKDKRKDTANPTKSSELELLSAAAQPWVSSPALEREHRSTVIPKDVSKPPHKSPDMLSVLVDSAV